MAGHQGPAKLLYHCAPQLNWGEKINQDLMGWDKDRQIAHQLQSWAQQTQLEETSLIYSQSSQRGIMRNNPKSEKHHTPPLSPPHPHPSSWAQLYSWLSLHVPNQWHRMTRIGVCGHFIICCLWRSYPLHGTTHHTTSLSQGRVLPTVVLPKLLQC